ncbi:MAG: nitroreductase family protein [Muribaculaceae bacterium]|nr:nitroreductase family protein [Muribaculaceae bacterium]
MNRFQELKDLLKSNRSYRRFDNSRPIPAEELRELVELTRFCSSGRNLQPLRYRIVTDREECAALYPALKWAGYFSDWDGPDPAQRPVAYLVQCIDTALANDCLCDDGLQLEAITLGAATKGIHGCIIKAFNSAKVTEALEIAERYKPRYVLALGYPAEKVEIVDTDGSTEADIKYYRDQNDTHIVPKRPLSEIII